MKKQQRVAVTHSIVELNQQPASGVCRCRLLVQLLILGK